MRGSIVVFLPGLTEAGGAARRSTLMARELADRGWRVRGVARAGTRSRFATTRGPRLFVLEVPGFGAPRLGALLFLLMAIPLGLAWGFRAYALLSVQLTSQTSAASICSWILKRPFISFLTTGGSISEVAYLISRKTWWIRKRMLSRASFLIAQTPAAANELEQVLPGVDVVSLANPVVGIVPRDLAGDPTALYSGRFSQEKDLLTLLKVWRGIAAEDSRARLTLLGAGGAYRSVESEIRSTVGDDPVLRRSVLMPGWVSNVDRFLSESDVYVFPSLSEGMSNSLLEACAAGRVVVASDISANKAVLGDTYPLLFRAGDEETMQEAIRLALYDGDARRTALARVGARLPLFDPQLFVDRIEELLFDAAHRARN